MTPRVASTGRLRSSQAVPADEIRTVEEGTQSSKTRSSIALVLCTIALDLRRLTVALVLPAVGAAALGAQEPEQWPQDDTYSNQQPANPQQDYGYPRSNDPQGYDQQQPAYTQARGLNAEQLEQLLAPIALYPDSLLAQTLAASTYPAQISAADQWRRGMGIAPPEQIAAGADAQTNWDPSVKALTAYPQVLAMMDQNLQWTTELGNAYYNQPQDVLETVQVLRQRAQAAGNLQTTPQAQVQDTQGYIALAPQNPEVVYVPAYNPWIVYGQPIAPYRYYEPFDTAGALVGAAIQFGAGIAVNAFFGMPFGFLSWGLDWGANAVLFHHDAWCSRSRTVADWGFAHGGPRAWRAGDFARFGEHYGERYGRGGDFVRYGDRYGRGDWNSFRNERGFNGGEGRFPAAHPVLENQNGFNRGYSGGRPGQGIEGRSVGGSSRGYLGYGTQTHPAKPQQYALNRTPRPVGPAPYRGGFGNRAEMYGTGPQPFTNRPQQFSDSGRRPGFGSGFSSRPPANYGGGRGFSQPYRALSPGFGQGGFRRPPANAFAGSHERSGGGFHPLGGGHNSAPSFGGGGHSFFGGGGGHGFGGGGGGNSSGGDGGHFGGGGHSGGGHSGVGGHGHHH